LHEDGFLHPLISYCISHRKSYTDENYGAPRDMHVIWPKGKYTKIFASRYELCLLHENNESFIIKNISSMIALTKVKTDKLLYCEIILQIRHVGRNK